jgi:hypothetical protein
MYPYSEKIGLSVLETGWLIQKTEAQVRGMLRRGELSYVIEGRKIDPERVAELVEPGLARWMLGALLRGDVTAPRPETRWGQPASVWAGLDALMLASPAMVRDARTGGTRIVPRLNDGQALN